jgi:hypothetical protein
MIEIASTESGSLSVQVDYKNCAYYKGEGMCSYGCYSEPICRTNDPEDFPLPGYYVTTKSGIHAHVLGDPNADPRSLKAVADVIDAAYKLFSEENNDDEGDSTDA